MTRLLSFSTLGSAHNAPRFWVEGSRLAALGFTPGTPIQIDVDALQVRITPALLSDRLVSFRRSAGNVRPVIDLNSQRILGQLAPYGEIKVTGTCGELVLSPSIRAFNIIRSLSRSGPLDVLDIFAGGGTLSDALADNPHFRVVGGLEIEPDFADEFAAKHPEADLIMGDFRKIAAEELPRFDVLIAGIPCTEHSNEGRAKKGLAGRPELGELGDLYVSVLDLMANRLPTAGVFENVPAFGSSLAGQTFVAHLERMGYSVSTVILRPNDDWAELSTRNRWVCIATLKPGFALRIPGSPCTSPLSSVLDTPDETLDRSDAERISTTIAGLRVHNARHAALGHGFCMKVLTGSEMAVPTILKSYHKINSSGFFVATPFGPRSLRKQEIARLHGQTIQTDHYATAVQMMGQGVLTRIFRQIFAQLGQHLHA